MPQHNSKTPPVLALTTGDPAGIGPEISLKAAVSPGIDQLTRLLLIGDRVVLEAAREYAQVETPFVVYTPSDLYDTLPEKPKGDVIEIVDVGVLKEAVPLAEATAKGGNACYQYIIESIRLCQAGITDGVVTAPINKSAMNKAGIKFPGHTEIFGEMTEAPQFAMMMYHQAMVIGLVTCHQSLRSVPDAITSERIVEVGKLLHDSLSRINKEAPHIAVLGLNPHAGEEGMFGEEERTIVAPAIMEMRNAGLRIDGPLSPDTAFTDHMLERYDAFLCLYHDQGLIPFKMRCFDEGVNVTMGLPFIRTSVDHGTAYDLAGKGKASVGSLLSAIRLATQLGKLK